MKKFVLSSAAVLALASAPALGADLAVPPQVPPPIYGWTGCYVGVAGGYESGVSNAKNDGTAAPPSNGVINITGNYRVTGGIAGGEAGCNLLQSGNWVLGVESDFSWTGESGSGFDQPPYNAATSNTTSEQWLSTERIRIGYAVNNNWLIYATGGFALASVNYSITNAAGIVGGTVSENHVVDGWSVGAGVEWAVGAGWSVKAEYLYVNFGNTPYFNFTGLIPITPGSGEVANRNGGVFLDDNIVRVGVNYKFNAGMLFGPL
jgi:outer membrane immunogenic protein